jgi:dienelactone hydrolase
MEKFVWLRPALVGAVCGAAALAVLGFSWGGWVTAGSAKKSAGIERTSAIAAALTPYCLERAKADPASLQVMAELKSASSYSRSDIIKKAGWATPLGSTEPNSDLAQACQIALGKLAS